MALSLKTSLLLFLFTLLSARLLAQKKDWQDVVYLKNGSIIRGELVADPVGGKVQIETAGRNLFVFPAAEVEKVTRELAPPALKLAPPAFKYGEAPGFLNMTELGLSVANSSGWNEGRQKDITIQTFNGYQFASFFALGLTAGVDTYDRLTLLPLGIGVRSDLTKTRIRPYCGLDAGYATDWLDKSGMMGSRQGGFFWSPGAGLKFNANENYAFLVSIGYRQQASTLETHVGYGSYVTENKFKRVLFRLGLSF